MTKRTVLITADVLPLSGQRDPDQMTLVDTGYGHSYVQNDLILTPDRIRAMLELAGLGDLFTGDGQFVSSERLAQALGVVDEAEGWAEVAADLEPVPEGMTLVYEVPGRVTLVFADLEGEGANVVTGIEWRDREGVIQTTTFETGLPFVNEGDVFHSAGKLWLRQPA